jgi:hypothetical protein
MTILALLLLAGSPIRPSTPTRSWPAIRHRRPRRGRRATGSRWARSCPGRRPEWARWPPVDRRSVVRPSRARLMRAPIARGPPRVSGGDTGREVRQVRWSTRDAATHTGALCIPPPVAGRAAIRRAGQPHGRRACGRPWPGPSRARRRPCRAAAGCPGCSRGGEATSAPSIGRPPGGEGEEHRPALGDSLFDSGRRHQDRSRS